MYFSTSFEENPSINKYSWKFSPGWIPISFTISSFPAGKYFLKVACNVFANSSNITDARIAIYKNGSQLAGSYNIILVSNQDVRHIDVTTSYIDTANGSSDYYEGYVLVAGGTVSIAFDASVTNGNNFFGYKIIE